MPLTRLLGGTPRPVSAYLSTGMDGPRRGIELAEASVEQGFRLMKVKTGYPTLDEDLRVVDAVLEVLRPAGVELAVDFNQSLTVPEALRRCRALDDRGLAWIEEPTRQDDHIGHAVIADEIRTPIMLGENWFGSAEMARCTAMRACDLVMPDLMKIGGISGWLRAASVADSARMPMSSHLFQEVSAQLMPVTPTAHWLELLDVASAVLLEPLRIERGRAMPSERPGTGVEWNMDAIKRFRL